MPADTSVIFIHSGMAGAPVLSGTPGALIALLDAGLINGFGTGNVDSVVIAEGVGTVTRSAGHPAQIGAVMQLAGATVTGGTVNGKQRVLSVTTTAWTFDATGLPNQSATGAITQKVAPAGWAKVFSATNLAVYKSLDPAATGCLLRVDDTGTTQARVSGYESMTDVNTGQGRFPLDANANGPANTKAQSADGTPVPWALACDGRYFHLILTAGAASAVTLSFGDILSVRSASPWDCALHVYSQALSVLGVTSGEFDMVEASAPAWVPRPWTSLGASTQLGRGYAAYGSVNSGRSGANAGGGTGGHIPFPNGPDGGLYLSAHHLTEPAAGGMVRGFSPGFWCAPQLIGPAVFPRLGFVDAGAALPGRKLRAFPSAYGVFFIDTTGPWR
ncbi:hypothetical protein G8A07_15545 [Roseateles sp. DAIF2]|uniref:hypothetical protein n=1 Tax=Roseateles sp. DAIF2 TaxID=2714952 RepID=UPI0018A2A0BE|nr:hypothetical protein [Roseateles sp. DAIF2]QPF74189.1 hypothetical protein G8A07_15545 [Roseateles sp. DAIF2]